MNCMSRPDGYRNVRRGKRRKASEKQEDSRSNEEFAEVSGSAAKCAWAWLIKQVYEVDPLMCL